jgi:hypothetical protein
MPTQTLTTTPILHERLPVGTDFVGGAEALPAKPATAGQIVPGSDFAGGAMPLTAQVEQGEPDEERAA